MRHSAFCQQGKPRTYLPFLAVALVLSLTACNVDLSNNPVVPPPPAPPLSPPLAPEHTELSAWVGATDSELMLTLSGDIPIPGSRLFTFNRSDCVVLEQAGCSTQYNLLEHQFVATKPDGHLSLNKASYAELYHQDKRLAHTQLSARHFPKISDHQAVYFQDRFWLVGGRGSQDGDDIWSSMDGRHWLPHQSQNPSGSETALFAGLFGHQLVVFDAAEAPGETDQGEQLWLIGGNNQYLKISNAVWSSSDGIHWTRHDDDLANRFSARFGHQVVVFDVDKDGQDELWLLGGNEKVDILDADLFLGDLWTSADGVSWSRQSGPASRPGVTGVDVVPARADHQWVAFDAGDGKGTQLWLFGGLGPDGPLNDIWSTPDGHQWINHGPAREAGSGQQALANIPRYGHQLAVFVAADDNDVPRLWLVGGWNGVDSNEVWSSGNGTHWVRHRPSDPAAANFAPRRNHQLVVTPTGYRGSDELWLLAGGNLNDSWSSNNGRDWTQQSPYADFSPRADHQAVVFDGRDGDQLWLVGGWNGDYSNEVWSSVDGLHWTQRRAINREDDKALFAPRYGHQLAVYDVPNDKLGPLLWLIGGESEGGRLNDIWSSSDGITWTQRTPVCDGSCFTPRYGHQLVVFDPVEQPGETDTGARLWLVGGLDNKQRRQNDVWSSADGVHWERHSLDCGGECFQERFDHQVVVFDPVEAQGEIDSGAQLWLIGGHTTATKNDVWFSANGVNWRQMPLKCGGACSSRLSGHQLVVFDPAEPQGDVEQGQQLWLFGGSDGSGNLNDEIWTSVDGRRWVRLTDASTVTRRSHFQALVYSPDPQRRASELWLIGAGKAAAGNAYYSNQVWRSPNGRDWRLGIKNPVAVSGIESADSGG